MLWDKEQFGKTTLPKLLEKPRIPKLCMDGQLNKIWRLKYKQQT